MAVAGRFDRVELSALLLVSVWILFSNPVLGTQVRSRASGVIEGVVVDAVTGKALPGIVVHTSLASAEPRRFHRQNEGFVDFGDTGGREGVLTDGAGRFRFSALPDGWYEVVAIGPRTVSFYGASGQQEQGRLLQVVQTQPLLNVRVELWRDAQMSGRVVDGDGRPVPAIPVAVLTHDKPPREDGLPATLTDERGAFTLLVPPGRYLVAVKPGEDGPYSAAIPPTGPAGETFVYPVTFHPGTVSAANALTVSIGAGEVRTGIDIRVQPVPAFSVLGPVGADLRREQIRLSSTDDDRFDLVRSPALRAGRLAFTGIPPGNYRLHIFKSEMLLIRSTSGMPDRMMPPTLDGPAGVWAEMRFAVTDRDVTVSPHMEQGSVIGGRVILDGANPPGLKARSDWNIQLESADDPSLDLRGRHLDDDRFETLAAPPGRYFIRHASQGRWHLRSVTAGGRDITDQAIELGRERRDDVVITLTDRPARLQGHVVRGAGRDVPRPWVAVFPAERNHWAEYGTAPARFARILTGADGRYEAILPAGHYYVVATAARVRFREDWARLAAHGETVSLQEGITLTRSLTLADVR